MISDTALKHFDQLWELFDKKLLDAGGSMFLIDPLREFLPKSFADGLTAESAKIRLHQNLARWGEIEQADHEIEVLEEHQFDDGGVFQLTQFKDPDVRWTREFIFTAFYNLCCLATHKVTIEELIVESCGEPNFSPMTDNSRKAFLRLIALSNTFLLSEWAQDLIHRAIANSDTKFFKGLCTSLMKNTARDRFEVARTWLGVTLLWYLGGKDFTRRDFMLLLRKKDIISRSLEELSFNAMLSKLKLIK
ncbi:MAG: hypothetical protein IH914_01800 [candidate division Zixibacteria bacterium]|nr:hypothetical protein [candidate division Zixibacteria bacterium]